MKTKTAISEELRRKFVALEVRMSPENLHCDGEISMTAARKRATAIRAERRELEREAGRRVAAWEVDRWW